jgi:hypothetical protein
LPSGKNFKGWRCGSMIEYLPSKCKALSSNPRAAKERKEGKKEGRGLKSSLSNALRIDSTLYS